MKSSLYDPMLVSFYILLAREQEALYYLLYSDMQFGSSNSDNYSSEKKIKKIAMKHAPQMGGM